MLNRKFIEEFARFDGNGNCTGGAGGYLNTGVQVYGF